MKTLTMLAATLMVFVSATFAMAADVKLQGAGATFPNPIYQRWVTDYEKLHPDIKIDYQSIGSGGGIKGITEKTIDFAGSDAPMTRKEIEAAKDAVVHIPTVAGGVVLAYNLPDLKGDLKLSGPVVAEVFMGKITRWSDAKIAALNPGVTLPDKAIVPVYRTDGSGTTFVFTNYLCTQSDTFRDDVGAGKAVKWPVGQGGKGSEGVTAGVQGTVGAIGYIEANYATANKIPSALMQNQAGKFVKGSPESVAAAGEGALKEMEQKGLTVNLWNQPGDAAYPIASFTYLIVYRDLAYLKSEARAKALVEYFWWATHDGEKLAPEMDYAPLAPGVQKKVEDALRGLTFNGQAVLPK